MNVQHQWFAVYTYPRHEKSVAEHLHSYAVEAFLPLRERKSRWTDRTVHLQTPLFPGYVFTCIVPQQNVRVLSAPGVIKILSFNGRPAPIPRLEIEALKLCLAHTSDVETQSMPDVGEYVRVRSGVLQGLVGQISQCRNDRRLIVPITLINQAIAVEVDVGLLEQYTGQRLWRLPLYAAHSPA